MDPTILQKLLVSTQGPRNLFVQLEPLLSSVHFDISNINKCQYSVIKVEGEEQCTLCGAIGSGMISDKLDIEVVLEYFTKSSSELCRHSPYCKACADSISGIRESYSQLKDAECRLIALTYGVKAALSLRMKGCTVSSIDNNNFHQSSSNPEAVNANNLIVVKKENEVKVGVNGDDKQLDLLPDNGRCTVPHNNVPVINTHHEHTDQATEDPHRDDSDNVAKEEDLGDYDANRDEIIIDSERSKSPLRIGDTETCKTCNRNFCSAVSFKCHFHDDGKTGIESSNENCSKTFNTAGNIVARYNICEKIPSPIVKTFLCYFCRKEAPNFSGMLRHMQIHTRELPYKCLQCKAAFATSNNLEYHTHFRHTNKDFFGKTYKCPIENCNTDFTERRRFFRHYLQCKNKLNKRQRSKRLTCYFCDVQRTSRIHLEMHMQSHTVERPYICDLSTCRKEWSCNTMLKRHVLFSHMPNGQEERKRLQMSIPPCYFCDRKFALKTTLINHIRQQHTLEWPANDCKECGKSFCSTNSLRQHKIMFHGTDFVLRQKIAAKRRKIQETVKIKNSMKFTG